jgi:hypothetical protein
LADVGFVELATNPTTAPQTRRATAKTQVLTAINVPILVGGQFTISATLFNPDVNQPSAEFAKVGANSFKFVEIFKVGNWTYLEVSDFATKIALVKESGDDDSKKRIASAYEEVKAAAKQGKVSIPSELMQKIDAAFKNQK